MARYQEEFETKGARFRIRNAEEQDAQSLIGFMRYVDRETTFLAREPGEFDASFPPEKEAALLKTWADGEEKLFSHTAKPLSDKYAFNCFRIRPRAFDTLPCDILKSPEISETESAYQ